MLSASKAPNKYIDKGQRSGKINTSKSICKYQSEADSTIWSES